MDVRKGERCFCSITTEEGCSSTSNQLDERYMHNSTLKVYVVLSTEAKTLLLPGVALNVGLQLICYA